MARATYKGAVLAESDEFELVEGNVYFPPDAVNMRYLRPSDTTCLCPWKGACSYYHVEVNGARNEDAAWVYPDPIPEAERIRNYIPDKRRQFAGIRLAND